MVTFLHYIRASIDIAVMLIATEESPLWKYKYPIVFYSCRQKELTQSGAKQGTSNGNSLRNTHSIGKGRVYFLD